MTKILCIALKKENGDNTNLLAILNAESREVITYAEKRSLYDYIDECLHGNNECAYLIQKFERVKDGKDAILWGDYETEETFISF